MRTAILLVIVAACENAEDIQEVRQPPITEVAPAKKPEPKAPPIDPAKLEAIRAETALRGESGVVPDSAQRARAEAIEQARTAGIIGSTALARGGAFASLTGTGGFDDTNIYGGLLGNAPADMNGGYGFGRSGFGPGGGGTGWGTIGTGRYGTIGHGTGSGYGVGGGRGGMGGRTAAVPTVTLGALTATGGDLDKAIIRRYLRRNQQKLLYCYEKELLAKPGIAGTVTAQFTIDGGGQVSASTASGVDPEVASCIAGVIKEIAFPKPKNAADVAVSQPFVYRPSGS